MHCRYEVVFGIFYHSATSLITCLQNSIRFYALLVSAACATTVVNDGTGIARHEIEERPKQLRTGKGIASITVSDETLNPAIKKELDEAAKDAPVQDITETGNNGSFLHLQFSNGTCTTGELLLVVHYYFQY